MRVLAFDLSTKTGWALFEHDKLLCYGQLNAKVVGDMTSPNYPKNYIDMATKMAFEVKGKITSSNPNYIVTEETNKGKNRYSQKQLEFIHFAVNHVNGKISYIDTSDWRTTLGITLDKEQRKDNRTVIAARKAEFDRIYSIVADWNKVTFIEEESKATNKRELNKIRKQHHLKVTQETKDRMKSFRYKEEGKVKGKTGVKNLSVSYVNEKFSLQLKLKDNDIADAICIGWAFIQKYHSKNN